LHTWHVLWECVGIGHGISGIHSERSGYVCAVLHPIAYKDIAYVHSLVEGDGVSFSITDDLDAEDIT
jgi:hypothetical protein